MPERIQLSRKAGYRKPAGAIVVTRGPGRKWGNPFVVGDQVTVTAFSPLTELASIPMTPEMAVACFRDLMKSRLTSIPGDHPDDEAYVQRWRDDVASLRGHDLACWCPPGEPCHGDVLLELANTPALAEANR